MNLDSYWLLQAEGREPELPRVLAGPKGHPEAGRRCHLCRGSHCKLRDVCTGPWEKKLSLHYCKYNFYVYTVGIIFRNSRITVPFKLI